MYEETAKMLGRIPEINQPKIAFIRATCLFDSTKYEEATTVLQSMLKSNHKNEEAIIMLGRSFYEQELYQAAVEVLKTRSI